MMYDRPALVDVLLHHRPTLTSACQCDGIRLGDSWPEHIADVYEQKAAADLGERYAARQFQPRILTPQDQQMLAHLLGWPENG